MDESPIKENYTSSKILINDLIRLTRSDQYIFRGISRRSELNCLLYTSIVRLSALFIFLVL